VARPPGTPYTEGPLFKLAGPILTALTVSLLGFFTSQYLSERQAINARIQLYAQLMTQREQSDSALRKDMFRTILDSFMKGTASSLDEQVLNLELLAYNFHESLNLKPLFIHLNKRIVASHEPARADLLRRLERVAHDVALKQLLILESAGASADRDVDLQELKQRGAAGITLEPASLVFDDAGTDVTVYVLAHNPRTRELRLRLEFAMPGNAQLASRTRNAEFSVSFYDFPMIDNTRLPGDRRVAVVLNSIDEHSAQITVAGFPGAYASLKEKPFFQDLENQLLRDREPGEPGTRTSP
jgi:hypothetical protein